MRLIYFDETKFSKDNPYFFIGGILLEERNIADLEQTLMQIQYDFFGTNHLDKKNELHGEYIYQGKGSYKSRTLVERIRLFEKVSKFLINNKIPIRVVRIDVKAHRLKYTFAEREYKLGLMLILEQFCIFLTYINDIGIVFGDYEKDEITQSILDFSQYKDEGTPMHFGRSIERLKDTIYFTHSHHSRFLQTADMVMYMTNRYETKHKPKKWHDIKLAEIWASIKENTDFQIKEWP